MNISIFRSLRLKMPLLVLTGIVPLILIAIFYASNRGTKTIRSEAEENLRLRANVLVNDINRWNEMNVLALKNLSRQENIRSMEASEQKSILVEIVHTYQHFYRATTIKLDGWTLARNDNRESQYRGDREYFKTAVKGDNIVSYQTLISRSTKKPALCMSTSIRAQKFTVVGVAMVCSNLEAITKQIGQMKFGQTGYAFLVDRDGKVLAHPNSKFVSGDKLTSLSKYSPVESFLEGNTGRGSFKDKDGIKWIYYSNRLDNNWGVIVIQQTSELLQGEKEFQNLAFLVASVAVLSVSILTFLLANHLIGPITTLTDSAIDLSNGKWNSLVKIKRKDELGILANSFNRMASQLKSLVKNLEKRIEQRTAQLQKSKEAAEKAKETAIAANLAKDRFLANISHELRTPLNSILGYTKIIQKSDRLHLTQAEHLQIVEQNGIHLLNLINDILDFSKTQLNKIELHPTELQLSTFLDGVVNTIEIWAEKKDIQLRKEWNNLPNWVQVDEKRLRQILINLLSNAIKFTSVGEITVKVSAIDYIKANGSSPKQKLRFEVKDTGIGMSDLDRNKIFQPFEQLGDLKSRAAGTGLGLSIANQLVELMGGKLQVKSKLGQGSTFWFELLLPVLIEVEPKPLQKTLIDVIGYKGTRRKVLIVDDRRENRDLLVEMLQPLGFDIATANNGEQMLEIASSFEPDLILLDLFMPVKTGFTSSKEIRQIPKLKNIPIIVITASSITTNMSHYLDCKAILHKPVNEQELLWNLQKYLGLEWIAREQERENLQKC
ncbi:MAG: ATP-binding protein [Prochloraceae cyanobacterium]|nr:ATP-binding protein [Prochloraceae cyanobacterium]